MISLKAQAAGQYKLRVLLHPESSLLKENPQPKLVAEHQIRVTEAAASSAHSRLSSFWPPQGPVAGTPAGAVIQVGAAMAQGPPQQLLCSAIFFSTAHTLCHDGMYAAAAEELSSASGGLKHSGIRLCRISDASQACDEFDNERRAGGDAFKASIRGLGADAVSITDRGDGSYALQYCIPTEGAFSLAVTGLDGQHLRGSPAMLAAFRSCTSSQDRTHDPRVRADLSWLCSPWLRAQRLCEACLVGALTDSHIVCGVSSEAQLPAGM